MKWRSEQLDHGKPPVKTDGRMTQETLLLLAYVYAVSNDRLCVWLYRQYELVRAHQVSYHCISSSYAYMYTVNRCWRIRVRLWHCRACYSSYSTFVEQRFRCITVQLQGFVDALSRREQVRLAGNYVSSTGLAIREAFRVLLDARTWPCSKVSPTIEVMHNLKFEINLGSK